VVVGFGHDSFDGSALSGFVSSRAQGFETRVPSFDLGRLLSVEGGGRIDDHSLTIAPFGGNRIKRHDQPILYNAVHHGSNSFLSMVLAAFRPSGKSPSRSTAFTLLRIVHERFADNSDLLYRGKIL
jgi:hypothetical protein